MILKLREGFKKGFLDSGPSKPKEKKKEEPIEIKPTKDKGAYIFKEQ